MPSPTPEPPWWPNGADEQLVRDCNCDYCNALVEALEQEQDGIAIDQEHRPLTAMADGGDDDTR